MYVYANILREFIEWVALWTISLFYVHTYVDRQTDIVRIYIYIYIYMIYIYIYIYKYIYIYI